MSSHYAIDYFATLGREPGPLKCKTFPYQIHEDDPSLSGPELWQEAITDVVLVSAEDQLPDDEDWIFASETIGQAPLEYPWIAFRKRKHSKRVDHITQIKFISSGETVPKDFELLRTTVSGKQSGYVKPFGFLAVRRALGDSYSYFVGEPMIYDICALKKSLKEEIPERYIPIERDSQGAWSSLSSDLSFAVRNLPAMGLCNLSYEAVTLDRYPKKDISPHIQLPEQALPVFAFPRNLHLEMALYSEYPLPVFYTFVFTDQEGHHMFAACLKFFEKVPLSALEPVAQEIYGNTDILNLPPDAGIFCPKVICVLSHKPFYRAMGRYLKHIYSLSLSSSICPLEHFITSVVSKIPLPCDGGRPFHVVLDAALIAPTSRPMKPVVFKMPSHRFFPLMDLDFAGPLRCLSVDMMLAVFVLMLREAKIVFLSSSNTMLTETMETLRCLLFPLTWSGCFVSRLPKTLSGLLQAPGGFMVGLHIEPSELLQQNTSNNSNTRNKSNNKQTVIQELMKKYIQYMHFDYPMLSGTYVIDLNSNLAYQFNGKYCEILQHHMIENILKTLPSGPKLRLRTRLQKIADEYAIAPQMIGLEALDSAFDFQQQSMISSDGDTIDHENTKIHWELFPTLEIRDSFLTLMIDLLGEYPKYMKPPNIELIEDTYRTFQEEFNIPEYLHDCGTDNTSGGRSLLEFLMETQMFSVLIQSRSEATAEPLVFFEDAARLQRELGLVAGGHLSGSKTSALTPASTAGNSYGVCELPEPLYVLLEAENRWANLSRVMQQQILQQSSLYNFEDKTVKQFSLKYYSTSSLAQIRHLGSGDHHHTGLSNVAEAFYPVNNQKLLDLLIFIDFSNGMTDIDDEFNVTGGTTTALNTVSYAALRSELARGDDLHLAESNYGALILPGPIIPVSYDDESSGSKSDHPHASTLPQYTYKDGWPQLSADLLDIHGSITHPKITDLIQERAFAINKINPVIRLLIRSPSERLTAENVTKLRQINVNAFTSVDPATFKIHKDITTAISALLDISSLSVMMLSLRVMNQVKPINDILQILGILAQIEYSGIHFYIHENIWRSVLVSCSAIGGDIMRRISVVIRDCLLSLQFHLDALTYGQFIKANHAAKVKAFTAKQTGDILDQFLHLEELGYVWYQQKSSPSPTPVSAPVATNEKGSKDQYNSRVKLPVKTPLQEALDQVIKQLILQKSEGLLPFHRPRQTSAVRLPLIQQQFAPQHHHLHLLKKEFQLRLDTIYIQVKKWADQQQQQQQLRALSQEKKGSSSRQSTAFSLNSSAISPLSSAMSKFGKGFFSGGNKSTKSSPVPSTDDTHSSSITRSSSSSSTTPPPLPKGFSFAKFLGGGSKSNSNANPRASVTDHSNETNRDSGGSTELDQVNLKLALDEVATTLPTIDESVDTSDDKANEEKPATVTAATPSSVAPSATPADHTTPTKLVIDVAPPPAEEIKPLSLNELQDRLLESFANDFVQQKRAVSIHNYNPCRDCGYVMMDEELMNVWFRASSIDVHKPTDRLRSCRDLNQDKGIICPECERSIHPKLFITCYTAASTSTAAATAQPEGENLSELQELWRQEVLFINPFLLRYEVEELLVKFGERINQIDWLYTYYPAIVWNILWYSNRCHLPSGFTTKGQVDFIQTLSSSSSSTSTASGAPVSPSKKQREDYFPKLYPRKEYEIISLSKDFDRFYQKDDLTLPVIIGWRESVAKAKILRLLQGKSGNYLDIRDLYPTLSNKEFEIITGSILSNLDGSPFGMRQAMLNLSDCSTLFDPILQEYEKSKQERQARQQKAEAAAKERKEKRKLKQGNGEKKESSEDEGKEDHRDSHQTAGDSDEEDGEDEGNESDDSTEAPNASPRGGSKRSIGSTTVSYRSATRKKDLEIARLIYMNLLILSIHFAKFQLYDPTKTGFNRDLEREAEFDRIYLDCVKCVLSKNDFEKLQTTEECLAECTKVHQRTNIVRGIFGLLP